MLPHSRSEGAPTCLSLAFTCVDLTSLRGLDYLGLVAVGQRLVGGVALVEREVADPVPWCPRCGCRGKSFGSVARRLAHVPFGTRPTIVLVHAGHYICRTYQTFWCDHLTRPAVPNKTSCRRPRLSATLHTYNRVRLRRLDTRSHLPGRRGR